VKSGSAALGHRGRATLGANQILELTHLRGGGGACASQFIQPTTTKLDPVPIEPTKLLPSYNAAFMVGAGIVARFDFETSPPCVGKVEQPFDSFGTRNRVFNMAEVFAREDSHLRPSRMSNRRATPYCCPDL
jgi:hypothetical protein